jgi:hypothetical protein
VLLACIFILFGFLCLIEMRLPLLECLNNTHVGTFLLSSATQGTTADLLTGLISAYVFYVFIDLLPRTRKEEKIKNVLNSLIASILDAYHQSKAFGHETEITHAAKNVLTEEWLNKSKITLQENKSEYLKLKFALHTAHSRIEDFRHSLALAINLSPDHAMHWLVITDKVKLLAELYEEMPTNIPHDKLHLINKDSAENPIRDFKSSLNFRFFEVVEEAEQWLLKS